MTRSQPRRCQVPESELLAYRDGELAASRQPTIADHVAACQTCRRRLADAAFIAETLQHGSPLRDLPKDRAVIRARIASDDAAWWRRPALAGALPAILLIVLALGVARWAADDSCTDCPPPPVLMRVTSSAGLPVGWQVNAPCQEPPFSTRMPPRHGQDPPSWTGQTSGQNQGLEQRLPPQPNIVVARMTTRQQPGATDGSCDGFNSTPRLGGNNGPPIGMAQSRSGPGT